MLNNRLVMVLRFSFSVLFAVVLMLGCDACEDNPTPVIIRPNYTVDLYIHQHAPEAFVDSSISLGGSLEDINGNKLNAQKIYFSVRPDSVGNTTPPDFTLTTVANPLGFRDNVKFTARRPGVAVVYARYYLDDILAAQDTLSIEVKYRGNE